MEKNFTAFFFCLLLYSLSSFRAFPQTRVIPPVVKPTVLLVPLPLRGEGDEGVRKVLASSMRLQLEKMGLQTLLFSTTEERELVEDILGVRDRDSEALVSSLLEFFSRADNDFLMVGGYIKEGEEIQVDYYLADFEEGRILASATKRAKIDFNLDEAMIFTLREMLPAAEARISEVTRGKVEEAARLAGEQEVTEEEGKAEAALQPEPVPEQSIGKRERFHALEFSLGFAPFIPVGAAGGIFNMSYLPFGYGNYRIPTSLGVIGLGGYVALNIFEPKELGLASYFHYLIPLGVDFRFTTPDGRPFGFFVRASAGAAFNVSDFGKIPESQQKGLSRFLSYYLAGVGAMVPLSRNIGLAIDAVYETFAYFWQPQEGGGIKADWIMGFVPAVYIYTRF